MKQALLLPAPVMWVERSWLEASFASLQAEYGSVEGYATNAPGIDAATLARIRAKLLR